MITGLNGRVYDSSGKRVEGVPHPELRSREQLTAARAAQQPKQPSGIPTGNPFEKTIAAELNRHNHNWAQSIDGQRVLGNLRRASEEWEANEKAKQEQSEFAASIADLVGHAETQVESVMNDPTASVEDCERAATALDAARAGNRDTYVAWEKQRHEQVTAALASEAAEYDSQARAAVEKRNAVLASALESAAVPEVKRPAPSMDIPVDRSRVAIRRVIKDGNSERVEYTYEDA